MMKPFVEWNVGRIDRALWPEAARLLTPGHGEAAGPAAQALVDRWSSDPNASRRLIGAFIAGRLRAAAWIEPLSGRSVVLWPPREVGSVDQTVLRAIMSEIRGMIAVDGVSWAQCLVKSPTPIEHALIQEIGFSRLGDLFYLFRPVSLARGPGSSPASDEGGQTATNCSPVGSKSQAEADLEFIEFVAGDRARLASIVEGSYQETLDYPQLNGLRSIDDVLDSYESIGSSGTSLWRIARCGAEEIGCLLLADHPDDGNLELVYMGVLPRFRGMGWGKLLVAQACQMAARRSRQRVVLAVDANNTPALKIYRSLGFSTLEQRAVYFWRQLVQGRCTV